MSSSISSTENGFGCSTELNLERRSLTVLLFTADNTGVIVTSPTSLDKVSAILSLRVESLPFGLWQFSQCGLANLIEYSERMNGSPQRQHSAFLPNARGGVIL